VPLRSAARHIHFWASAVVQSLIFVALHEDSQAYPFLFAFAMAGSWLALRSGGLLAPIAMLIANNAFAMLAILGSTQSGK